MTITVVVPLVLDLNSHLQTWHTEARHCQTIVRNLHESLKKRFRGIFIRCLMEKEAGVGGVLEEPFFDKIFLMAPVLDPQYMMHWVDEGVQVGGCHGNPDSKGFPKGRVKRQVKETKL